MMMGLDLLLIGLAAYAFGWRPQLNQARPAQTSQSPVEILKARFAIGDITREEYLKIRRDLEG